MLLLGLGVNQGGIGIARYLCRSGAEVTVTDLQPADRLTGALEELSGLPIQFSLGGHRETDVDQAEIIVRNPGVPADSPWLQRARANQVRIEMEMTLFFRECEGRIIGITGTKGKTTTSTMVASMLKHSRCDTVLAGNMGRSALDELPNITAATQVVIELSSFQLEGLDEHRLGPRIALITNISPDHLDRYRSFDEYARTKMTIFEHLPAHGWRIFSRNDEVIRSLLPSSTSNTATFGTDSVQSDYATGIDEQRFSGIWDGQPIDLGAVSALPLPGEHARMNVLGAATAALASGVASTSIKDAIPLLQPVENRLETIATVNDVRYVNDTTATVPEAAVAAIRAFPGSRIIVIAGGSEKHLDLTTFANELVEQVYRVVLLNGDATARLQHLLEARSFTAVDGPFLTMKDAVNQAASVASPGDVVLLSPGCASFGMFRNEFERGNAFRAAVAQIESRQL